MDSWDTGQNIEDKAIFYQQPKDGKGLRLTLDRYATFNTEVTHPSFSLYRVDAGKAGKNWRTKGKIYKIDIVKK